MVRSGIAPVMPRDDRSRAAPLADTLFADLRGLRAAMSVSSELVATQYCAKCSIFHDFATQNDYIKAT
jgi:hypothetical protein